MTTPPPHELLWGPPSNHLVLVRGATGETVASRLAAGQSLGLLVSGIGTLVAVGQVTNSRVYDGLPRALGAGLVASAVGGGAGAIVARSVGASSVALSVGSTAAAAVAVVATFVGVLALLDRADLRLLTSVVGRHD